MGLSNTERRKRLRDLLETAYTSKGAAMSALVRAACAEWSLTARTAREYVQTLIDAGWLRYTVPGGPLEVTSAGERELGKADAEIDSSGQLKITPTKDDVPAKGA